MPDFSSSEHSRVDRFISSELDEEQLRQADRAVSDTFQNQSFANLAASEREKSPLEHEIWSKCQDYINQLRTGLGLETVDLPEKNVHIIKEEGWSAPEKGGGYKPTQQGAVIKEKQSNLETAAVMFHEMLHFASYSAMEYRDKQLGDYRFGLIIRNRHNNEVQFEPLNEALTAEMTKRFISSLADDPIFSSEHHMTEQLRQENTRAMSTTNQPLFTEDTYFADRRKNPRGKTALCTAKISYPKGRQALSQLCQNMAEKNGIKPDSVFQGFCRSYFDGNVLSLGRAIESTYGPGTFRKIGEQKTEQELLDFISQLTGSK